MLNHTNTKEADKIKHQMSNLKLYPVLYNNSNLHTLVIVPSEGSENIIIMLGSYLLIIHHQMKIETELVNTG